MTPPAATNGSGPWAIVCEFKGKNAGTSGDTPDNEGGMILYLVSKAGVREEVSRVAVARRLSKNPDTEYGDQLRMELDKARVSVALLNEQFAGAGEFA